MSQRSITSPGVEISELDHSLTSRPIGSTDILITGFADQGPTEEFTMVGGITEYEQVFGTPTNSAERYLYYTAKQILLSSPANLMVSRLPYGSNLGDGYANSYSALVYPVVNNGVGTDIYGVTTLTLTFGGSGYKTAPSIEFIGGGLNGSSPISKAKAVANIVPLSLSAVPALSSVAGSVTSISIIDAGFGYLTLPTIELIGGGYDRIATTNTGSLGVVETVTQDYDTATSYKIGEPTSILLTDEEYNQLLQNDIEWQTGYTPSITSFADIGKAGLVVLNDTKTSINNKYEGYYVALADNTTFNPSTDFVCVTGIKTVTSNNDLSQTCTKIKIEFHTITNCF